MLALARELAPPLARPGIGHRVAAAFCARPYAPAVAAVLMMVAVPFATRPRTEWDTVYIGSAERLVAGEDLYAKAHGYTYPPFQAAAAIPLVGLAKPYQRAIWFVINAVCLVYLLREAWRLAGGGSLCWRRDYPEHLACGLGLAVGIGFLLNALSHQQTDVVLAALIVGGISCLVRERTLQAATLFGLAAAMKCTPLLFAPYLLLRGRLVAAAWVIVVALGMNLLPDLVERPAGGGTWLGLWHERYLEPMTQADYAPGVWASEIVYNQSAVGLVNRWGTTSWSEVDGAIRVSPTAAGASPGSLRVIIVAIAVACGAVALAVIVSARRKPVPGIAGQRVVIWECGIVIAGMLLFSPMSSPAHFGLLIVPAFALARAAVIDGRGWARTALAIAVIAAIFTNKDLCGARLHTLALWYGKATWATVAILLGCLGGLLATLPSTLSPLSQILSSRLTTRQVEIPDRGDGIPSSWNSGQEPIAESRSFSTTSNE